MRVINDVLGTLIDAGKLGTRPDATAKADPEAEQAEDRTGQTGG